jgi:hypothetical protein
MKSSSNVAKSSAHETPINLGSKPIGEDKDESESKSLS